METTVKHMKLGSKLVLGRYGVRSTDEPDPIVWQKATPNCDFISEEVLDKLSFDAEEPSRDGYGKEPNSDWKLSNLRQFLNSEAFDGTWYTKSHPDDTPPETVNLSGWPKYEYKSHYGFLHYFEDYELASIREQTYTVPGGECSDRVRLLSVRDVFDREQRFNIFKKLRGVRAQPTYRCSLHRSRGGATYMPYFLLNNRSSTSVHIVSSVGDIDSCYAGCACGIRPTLRVSPDTVVTDDELGTYTVVPFDVHPLPVCTDEELLRLLGLPAAK